MHILFCSGCWTVVAVLTLLAGCVPDTAIKEGTSCDIECAAGSDPIVGKEAEGLCSGKANGDAIMQNGALAGDCRGKGTCSAACVRSQLCCEWEEKRSAGESTYRCLRECGRVDRDVLTESAQDAQAGEPAPRASAGDAGSIARDAAGQGGAGDSRATGGRGGSGGEPGRTGAGGRGGGGAPSAGTGGAAPKSVISIAPGSGFTCQVLGGGAVECWGGNTSGQLGNETNNSSDSPVLVKKLAGRAKQVVAGYSHACALLEDATVQCWGYNYFGQLGDGTKTSSNVPVFVKDLSGVTQLATGSNSACALHSGGSIACWGNNINGELGSGSTDPSTSSTPLAVVGIRNARTIQLSPGRPGGTNHAVHACAITADSKLLCWGGNNDGELGNGQHGNAVATPSANKLMEVRAVGLGTTHGCAALNSGQVNCWGAGGNGRLGRDDVDTPSYEPIAIEGLSDVTSLAGGVHHMCARRSDGVVLCWGGNEDNALGDGTGKDSATPVLVSGTGIGDARELIHGFYTTCALLEGDRAQCWGG